MMGPYKYKTVWLKEGVFTSGERATHNIQAAIDSHVEEGWELFECHPITTATAWRWTILIFRQPQVQNQ